MKMDRTKITLGMAILAAAVTRTWLSLNMLIHVLWQWHTLRSRKVCYMTMDMRRMGITATAMLFVLALAIPAFTMNGFAASSSPYQQQVLQARYDMVSARVNFVTGVLSDTASLVTNASDLNGHVDKLNGDLNTLKGYVGSNDNNGFNSYLTGTIQPDMQSALTAMKDDMKQFKAWGVSASTIQQLKTDYQNRKSTYDQQTNAAIIELGNARLSYYNDVMSKDSDRMSKLSAAGIDVSGMQSVKDGAQSSVVDPLQSAINANDANAVKQQLHDNCIGNGQPYSYHFFAKSDLEALKATSAKIGSSVNNSTVQQQLADVNAKLSDAQAILNSVGTSPYTSDQQTQVWNNLKAASDGLKTIIQEIKSQNHQG